MRVPFLVLVMLLRWSCFAADKELTEEELNLIHLLALERRECARQIRDLSQEQRVRLYSFLRGHLDTPQWRDLSKLDSTRLLFGLGEPQARQEAIESFRRDNYNDGSALYWIGDPTVIEALVPDLFRNEPLETKNEVSDLQAVPLSFRAAAVMRETIIRSNMFSPDVVDWAKRNSWDYHPGLKGREAFRQWWRDNAEFFKKKEYASVKSGEDFLERPVIVENASADTRGLGKAAAPTAETPLPSRLTKRVQSAPTATSKYFAGTLITIVCAVLTAFFVARRRG